MRQWIMNHIKYCEVCQLSTKKHVEKCPHKMHPVSVPQEIWCKIGKTRCNDMFWVWPSPPSFLAHIIWIFNTFTVVLFSLFVGIDLVGPLRECNGYKYLVTAVNYFSKYVEAKLITEKTGEQIGLFIYQLFCRYGVMQVVVSDNGEHR